MSKGLIALRASFSSLGHGFQLLQNQDGLSVGLSRGGSGPGARGTEERQSGC